MTGVSGQCFDTVGWATGRTAGLKMVVIMTKESLWVKLEVCEKRRLAKQKDRHPELSIMLHNIRWLIGRVIFHSYYKPCLALGVSWSLMLF